MADTDDTRVWVEVVDVVLGPALLVRTLAHMMATDCVFDEPPEVPDNDVMLCSPIPRLRGHFGDVLARVNSSILAVAAWFFTPIIPPTATVGLVPTVVSTWLCVQFVVLWADPLALVYLQLTDSSTTDSDTDNDTTQTITEADSA